MSEYKKSALVCGAGGMIGSHMVKRLVSEGYWVRGVDLKYPEFSSTQAQEFIIGDLTNPEMAYQAVYGVDESISLLLIWVEQDIFLLEIMMQM